MFRTSHNVRTARNEERWTKEGATWNQGLGIETKSNRRVGRPRKRLEDDINQFVKLDKTEETRGSDLKNNDSWFRAGKDKKDDASVVKADEGKQKQHAECVDNTAATQLSKLSDINLSCAPEQDLGLKSLNPVEIRQKSRHPPLYTTGPSSELEDSMVWSFRFSQTFFFFN